MELKRELFVVKDFSLRETIDKHQFTLNKTCTIFHKQLCEEPLYLWVHNSIDLSNYISRVSDYINWLGTECENDLIKYFNENMKHEKLIDTRWYKEMRIYSVTIIVTEHGEFETDIRCEDCYFERDILHIVIKEQKIYSMEYLEVEDFGDEYDGFEDE
jgi:hypothetical protein